MGLGSRTLEVVGFGVLDPGVFGFGFWLGVAGPQKLCFGGSRTPKNVFFGPCCRAKKTNPSLESSRTPKIPPEPLQGPQKGTLWGPAGTQKCFWGTPAAGPQKTSRSPKPYVGVSPQGSHPKKPPGHPKNPVRAPSAGLGLLLQGPKTKTCLGTSRTPKILSGTL